MKRFAHILLLTFLMVTCCQAECRAYRNQQPDTEKQTSIVTNDKVNGNTKYNLRANGTDEQQTPQSVLDDASERLQTETLRPQRILSNHGPNPQRPNEKLPFGNKHNSLTIKRKAGYGYLLITPIPANASSDYYVFALRHIIR